MSDWIDTTEPLRSFTVYYDPADYPGKYVVRGERIYPGLCVKDPEPAYVGDSLADARDVIPLTMTPLPRMTGDPPPIVEVWI